MNVYIWERLDNLTSSWHNGGGLVVTAPSLDRARELALIQVGRYQEAEPDAEYPQDDIRTAIPTYAWASNATSELVLVFPDAGCC